jgi:IS5 family transposase
MADRRFQELGAGSIFGRLVYDRAVPQGHFLRQLDAIIDWPVFTEMLLRLYKGGAEVGRPPYDPVVILKMLVVSYMYNLSERQTEAHVNDSISAKCFLGLAVDEPAPDHSTLARFKERIVKLGKEAVLEELLAGIVLQAQEKGVEFGTLQVVDSTHTIANVNTLKDKRRQVEEVEYFYGYKMHTSMNAEAEMITSVVVTDGSAHDGKQFRHLLERDERLGLPVETYAGDRGYDDSDLHYLLEKKGLHSALRLNTYRTEKKDPNKQVWVALKQSEQYQAGQSERYKIERKFGEAKENHPLRRCRYLGRLRYAIQAYLTAIVLNLKRIVWVLTGVPFKGRATLGG